MLWLLLPRLINQTVSLLDSAHNDFTFSSYFLQAHGWETSFKNFNSDFWVIPWFHQLEFTKEADEYPEACNISKHKTRLYLIEHTSKHIWYQERACSVGGPGYWEKFQENKMTWREEKLKCKISSMHYTKRSFSTADSWENRLLCNGVKLFYPPS